ncbi:MAG TPA: DUF4412 domain-containing protein [Terriglobales bacterium]|nr:DUF4412 domain-containing protein [Terriglobales bacterium]
MNLTSKGKARVLIAVFGVMVITAALMPTATQAQLFSKQFSADMSMKTPHGVQTGKIYVGDQKIRWDMNTQGHQGEMITDAAAKTAYMIMPQQKMYIEYNMRDAQRQGAIDWSQMKHFDPNNPCATSEDYTCKKVGSESVNGRSCDKWLFTSKTEPSKTTTAWIDQKLHFPVRSETSNGVEWNLANIQEGSQDASLFQVPAGYRKFDMGAMGTRQPQ